MADSYTKYLPTIDCKVPNALTQIERLKDYTTREFCVPDHLFNYHHFPELLYKKVNTANSIYNSLKTAKKESLAKLKEEERNEPKKGVGLRATMTGRSGDGKTFLLYHLADLASNDCFFIPIHQATVRRFEALINSYAPFDLVDMETSISLNSQKVLCSYLLELEKIIDSGQNLSNLEIMELFNNGFIATIFENAKHLSTDILPDVISARILEKTNKLTVFVMDEAHVFTSVYREKISRPNNEKKGSLLTEITRTASGSPVICCSTKISGVQLEIDISGPVRSYVVKFHLDDYSKPLSTTDVIVDNPFDFISYFMNVTEEKDREETKRYLNILLNSSPVRISAWICDEYFKAALVAHLNNKKLSKRELLNESVRRVFTEVMPQYGKMMEDTLNELPNEIANVLNFIWTGVSPHKVNESDYKFDKTLQFLAEDSYGVNLDVMDKENRKLFLQEMLSLGCGKAVDGVYKFSDPFFKYAYLSSMAESSWSPCKELLGDTFNSLTIRNRKCLDVSKKGFLYERVVALLLLNLSQELKGEAITNLPLFEQFKGTWLDNYTLKLESIELDNRFAAGLIYFGMADRVVASIDKNNCGDLFFSLVPIKDDSDMKISAISSVKFESKSTLSLSSTNLHTQKIEGVDDFFKLLKISNHHPTRCLRIVFVDNHHSLNADTILKQTNQDEKCIVFSMSDPKFRNAISSHMPTLSPILQSLLKKPRPVKQIQEE